MGQPANQLIPFPLTSLLSFLHLISISQSPSTPLTNKQTNINHFPTLIPSSFLLLLPSPLARVRVALTLPRAGGMRSVVNDAKKRKLLMAEEGDTSNDWVVQPPEAEEDHCSSTDVSTLDQASAASGCSCSVDMAAASANSEEEEEEEPDDVQLETSSMRRCNSSRGEEVVIEGNDVDLDQSRRRRPAEAELEEFFAEAEPESREQKKRLVEKYNFDFDMEKPLEGGRYEWVRLSPMKKKIKN